MLRPASFLENSPSLKLLRRLKSSSFALYSSDRTRKQWIISGLRHKFTAASVKVCISFNSFFMVNAILVIRSYFFESFLVKRFE